MHLWCGPFCVFVLRNPIPRLVRLWVFGCLVSLTSCGFAKSLILNESRDDTVGEVLLTVPESEDSAWSFQWFIDGRALTATPIAHAGQLVLYLDKGVPGREYAVTVYQNAATLVSRPLILDLTPFGGNPSTDNSGNVGVNTSDNQNSITQPENGSSVTHELSLPQLSSLLPAGSSALVNLSARGQVKLGSPLIAGLIVSGSEAKPILIRAVGPTLANYGVASALRNPTLTLYHEGTVIQANDDWDSSTRAGVTAAAQMIGAFPLVNGGRDAALLVVLPPGAYTAHINSADLNTGTALVEFYDVSAATIAQSRLRNLSSRGYSSSGNDVMVVGFIIGGDRSKTVLVRALGPMLSQYGVNNVMPDPKLELHTSDSIVGVNDDWSVDSDVARIYNITQAAGAPVLPNGSRDAVLAVTLNPGAYTAVVTTGASSTVGGEVLVEVYEISD